MIFLIFCNTFMPSWILPQQLTVATKHKTTTKLHQCLSFHFQSDFICFYFSAGDFFTLTHSNNPSSSPTLLHNWTDKMTTRISPLLITVHTHSIQFNSPQSSRSQGPSPGLHWRTLDAWYVFLGSYYCHFLLVGSLGHCSAAAGQLGPNTDDHSRAPRATEPN